MRYNFDDIIDRRGSGCVKYDDLSAFGNANVIPLWIADMDFEAPEFICQAIARRAAHRVFGYGMRTDAYYAAITNWVERRNGWHIDREWIDFTPGVVAGFVFALRAPVGRGRRYRHHASRLSSVRRPDKSQRPAGSGKPAHSRKGILPDRLRRPRPQTGRGHGTALLQSTQPHRAAYSLRRSCAE